MPNRFSQDSSALTGNFRTPGARDLTEREIEEERLLAEQGDAFDDDQPIEAAHVILDNLPPATLLMLRARIDSMLAGSGLTKLNLEDEFLVQLAHARGLQADLRAGRGKPSELAAALNATTSVLKDLVKLREQVVSLERMAKLEAAIVKVMREQSPDVRDAFLARYKDLTAQFGEA